MKAYISKLTFNNGDELEIKENDIVLFVGANNVGKSQALEDIFVRCGRDVSTVVVSDVETTISEGSLLATLEAASSRSVDNGHFISFNIFGGDLAYHKGSGEISFRQAKNYGDFRNLFVAKLSTEMRLNICYPASIINRNDAWTNPIHYVAFDYKYTKWLSDRYQKAFGENLIPNIQNGSTIPLCIGPAVKISEEYDNETERIAAYAKILESYKQVHKQGDGVKSFVGILLYLMLDYYSTYLIDEPESFLHPPQARMMGQIIGETLREDQQAFISTHSEEIVKGLLDVCDNRLKIVRITRNGETNTFSILDNNKIKEVFEDPLLKYSNIMSGLFHKKVVLCESDSDCKLYSAIETYIKQQDEKYSETLFIHCGGKNRMAKTAQSLLCLGVDVKLIPDIDVLNDKNTFKGITDTFAIEWQEIERDYSILISNICNTKEKVNRNRALQEINHIIEESSETELTKEEIKNIQKILDPPSKWESIKKGGKHVIPSGDATSAFNRIDRILKEHGIFIVPVGELEGFVKEVGGHGPTWINRVFEEYPELDNSVYEDVRNFIKELDL